MLPVNAGAGVLLTVLDKAAMQQGVLCGRPGCAHSAKKRMPCAGAKLARCLLRGGACTICRCFARRGRGQRAQPCAARHDAGPHRLGRAGARLSAPYEACGQMEWYAGEDMLYLFLASEARGPGALCPAGGGAGRRHAQPVPVSPGTEVLGVWDGTFSYAAAPCCLPRWAR